MLTSGRHWRLPLCLAVLVLFVGAGVWADQERVTGANYAQAFKYSPEFLRQFVYSTSVQPHWIGKNDCFWYEYQTSQGTQYWRVDPQKAQKEPLFDRNKLGALLSEQVRKPLDPAKLPLTRVTLDDDGAKMKFVTDDFQYEYDLKADKLAKLGKAPAAPRFGEGFGGGRGGDNEERRQRFEQMRREMEQQQEQQQQQQQQQQEQQQQQNQQQQQQLGQQQQGQRQQQQQNQQGERRGEFARGGFFGGDPKVYSPDRKMYVFIKDNNLCLAEAGKEKDAVALTTDCSGEYCFSQTGMFGQQRSETQQQPQQPARPMRPTATWSSDSKFFYATRFDTRGVQELFLVDSLGDPRPKLQKYNYPMPGEEAIRRTELFVCDASTKKLVRIPSKWKHESYTNLQWGKTGEELRFVRTDRLLRNLELCTLNTKTSEQKCLITEGFENATVAYQPARQLEETDEMIWWSERTGWGHYYLYERSTGKFKNAITSGPFRASRIVSVDAKARLMWFLGNAREAGENVYYEHLYRVRFDGTDLTLLDSGDATHQSTLSPSKQFLVDNWTRMDQAPKSLLRDGKGNIVMELEKTDLTRLKQTGWQPPETFCVKAADGVTDLYGNMWKPFDFNPKKKYPIIAHVYPGPQTEGVQYNFSPINGNQQLAQLGFIVIQVGHRGGAPTRSKAYHSYGYFNLRDYGLADKKAAIEQLAIRHPFIDIDRVGIYGHSGGGFMSAAALLQKPYNDFFKAAVASAGNHDNNIYNNMWAERYHGMREVVKKDDDAKKTTAAQTNTNTQQNQGGTERRGGGRRVRGGGAEDDSDDDEPGTDDKDKKVEAKDDSKKNVTDDKAKTDAKKEDKAGEKKATDAKTDAKKAEEKKATDKKLEEKKATDAKTDVKKAEEKKATDGKTDVKKAEEKKATDAKTTTDKKTEEKKEEKKEVPPEMKFEIKVPTNAELAGNLKGALLLVHGEIDNNVHPANTMRLVDALIKANKRFDMLILPGQRHGFGSMTPYFNQRMWDFFAEHLLEHRNTSADILEKSPPKK